MNILLLTTHLNTGGITSYLYTLSKGLIARGHDVHIASGNGNRREEFEGIEAKIKIINIRTKSELSPKIYAQLSPLKKYIRENKIDCIHAHTRITQVMGVFLKRLTRCPYVSTCHGFFKTRLSRRMFPCWGDKVIAISQAVERHLEDDFRVSRDNVTLIPNGIDLDEFVPMDQEKKLSYRRRFNLGRGPVIGIIARLSDVKGQDILIKAMVKVKAQRPEIKLLIIGEGKTEKDLHTMVQQFNLKEQVQFIPVVNNTPQMLSLLDIFVMPSRQEGLGLSIMEAQASGLPVIASRVGGIPDLIEDGKTGFLVNPGDPDALAETITSVIGDKQRLTDIGAAGLKFIKNNYSAGVMVDKTIQLYRQLTGGS